ncbi:septal ring lytic transglycosylase RlpA family protein [Cutibacterium sp.]|uniref:septal ring lytic transglycosylase RlpA family protein n=1 Tax=Cutibacterium sp. TaxID=1912221 RepID=UPI0026DAF02E|nr:septal ring lytic transglycosylase RlpA family protein [Cutibacterium sp.]MDO4412418.1 septal ring lytic transglycosylase RlpA family protein [Cutibacterium sp.]
MTNTSARTTLTRTVALTAAAGLAVMGTIAEEAHAAPAEIPGTHTQKAPAQQSTGQRTTKTPAKQTKRATTYTAQFAQSRVHLNVRSGRGTDYKRHGLIHPGDRLLIVGKDVQGWTPVNYRGKTSWVATRYITKVTRPVGIYAQRGDHNARTKAVQRDLSTLNYFPSKWVGLPYGPSTTNAVKVFQKANALKQTGVTDAVTVSLLRSKAGAQRAAEAEQKAAQEKSAQKKADAQESAQRHSSSRTSRSSERSTSSDVSTSGIAGSCEASFYSDSQTASGESFNSSDMTAASKTYSFGTRLKVTNKANGRSVVVRVNDRGPYVSGRCLDLSPAAFNQISSPSAGVADVTYEKVS